MNLDNSEQELTGGNTAAKVVRIGSTVHKPPTAATPNVEAFLLHLAESGFVHSPRSFGRDHEGRHVLEFIDGETISQPRLLTIPELRGIAAMIRQLHQISATFPLSVRNHWNVAIQPDKEELICHNDLGPWNLVRQGARWVFIDWDGSGPASRLWDLAYAAQSFVPLAAGGNPDADAMRLAAFVDGYSLDQQERKQFSPLLTRRTEASYELLRQGALAGIQPWARMYTESHGEYWRQAAAYVREHERLWAMSID